MDTFEAFTLVTARLKELEIIRDEIAVGKRLGCQLRDIDSVIYSNVCMLIGLERALRGYELVLVRLPPNESLTMAS